MASSRQHTCESHQFQRPHCGRHKSTNPLLNSILCFERLKEIHEMENNDLLAQLKSRRAETLSSLVAEELERMIIRGELQAGDRINESALAQMFSISRGPIREACRSLEKSNLVRLAPHRGVLL